MNAEKWLRYMRYARLVWWAAAAIGAILGHLAGFDWTTAILGSIAMTAMFRAASVEETNDRLRLRIIELEAAERSRPRRVGGS